MGAFDDLDAQLAATKPAPAPSAFADLDAQLASYGTGNEGPKIGLSGPGSKDPDEIQLAPTMRPAPGMSYADIASGKTMPMEDKLSTLKAGAALKGLATHPVDTVTDPSKRRELERGVSDVVTLGGAQKLGEAVDPVFAATAKPDAEAAPGYRDLGVVGGSALPNPIAVGVGMAAKKVAPILTAPIRKLIGSPAVEASEGVEAREATGSFARSDKRILRGVEDGATIKLGSKIKEKPDAIVDVVRRNPDLLDALHSAPKRAAEAEKILTRNNAQTDGIYHTADMLSPPIGQSSVVDEFKAAMKEAMAGKNKPVADAVESLQTKHLYDQPDATWSSKEIRRLVSDLQDTAFNVGPAADPTPVREAAADIAGRLRDALEAHVERATKVVKDIGKGSNALATPEQIAQLKSVQGQFTIDKLRELNADSTALIRIKKAAEYAAKRDPGNRLNKIADHKVKLVLDSLGMGAAIPTHGMSLAVPAIVHGAPWVIKTADEGFRAIAAAAIKNKVVPSDMIAAAVKAGARRPVIAALMTRLGATEGTDGQ